MVELLGQNAAVTETTLPSRLPDLDGTVAGGDPLRDRGRSEVWRIRLDGVTPKSVIAKRGLGEPAADPARDWIDELVTELRR
ncbi:hypothetical protein [Paractinoplanes durhamensis]|uniref:Uncharacterized protein n=1 Tax=Paractinoplanes durhamensis TaxID=113563 RepID=A0ABQ3Z996_9ACTN|nr:hypothetical protein [Actinoplanes durhamensis]GIE06401.1 hypothetical protein Adu01nite_77510 [Actinoplanes durhamensis]